jgi:hypothetical protein
MAITNTNTPTVLFSFQQDLAELTHRRAIKTAFILAFGIILLSVLGYHDLLPDPLFSGLTVMALLVVGLFTFFNVADIYSASKGTGEWLIQITPEEFLWQSPAGIGQQNFSVKVSEILKLVVIYNSNREDGAVNNHGYYLIKHCGEEIKLQEVQNLDLDEVFLALEDAGVKCLR